METAAGRPVEPAPGSGVLPAGGHVRQLLNLAHALAGHGATASEGGSADGTAGGAALSGPVLVDVASLTDAECVGWAQDVEASLRLGQALAVQVAGELGRRVQAGRFAQAGSRGPVGLLVDALQLSAAEASRRLKLAAVVLPVVDGISAAVAPVAHPMLGEAFLSGAVSQERASMVARYLADADRLAAEGRITDETCELVEESLVGTARLQGPDFVRSVGNQILGHLDPDGQQPSHAELLAKQGLFFHRPRNGLISFHGAVTILQHEELMAALDGFTNPNKHKNIDTITGDTSAGRPDVGDAGSASSGGRGGGAGGEVEGCEGQSSLLDDLAGLGGVAGLFPPTVAPTAQPGPPPANSEESGRSGRPEPPAGAGAPGPEESPEPQGLSEPPQAPDAAELPEPPVAPVRAEPPGAPVPLEPPGAAASGVVGGGAVRGGVGWWGRRLEPWEIPARPPEAPEYATPPVYEGQDWFWLPTEPATRGWTTPTTNSSGSDGDFFNMFQDAPARWPATGRDDTFTIWQEHTAANALATAQAATNTPASVADPGVAGASTGTGAGAAQDTDGDWGTNHDTRDATDGTDVGVACDARVEQALAGLDTIDPASTDPAVKDTRTRAQQLLDGLISCVKLASRTGKLPRNGGLKAQLILSCSQTELERAFAPGGAGTINTTFNGTLPLRLFETALCDPEITRIVYGQGQEILNAGRTQRLFTGPQRRILYARDLGCSFPDCTIPATWTEAHHIIPWQAGGETSIAKGTTLKYDPSKDRGFAMFPRMPAHHGVALVRARIKWSTHWPLSGRHVGLGEIVSEHTV